MIQIINPYFILQGEDFTYAFRVLQPGILQHLYFGEKKEVSSVEECEVAFPEHYKETGNSVFYDYDKLNRSLEDIHLEASFYGKGDIFEPLMQISHDDGSMTNDFLYDHYEIKEKKGTLETLPASYGDAPELIIYLKDHYYNTEVELHYCILGNVLVRSCKLINHSSKVIQLEQMNASLLDLNGEYIITSFRGNWANEMNQHNVSMTAGKYIVSSFTGTSSSRCNPFFMLSKKETTEQDGEAYGFNLIYSGNHYNAIETGQIGRTRITQGINPTAFCFEILPEESFESPEAIMTYSNQGWNHLSENMHHFVREHIVRGKYKNQIRPILVNSWEACYMDINEDKIVQLAAKAKQCGIEMVVMDDGWFGHRYDDHSSLGDWDANLEKLPGGLDGLSQKIHALDMKFGIWVEPEMISVDSDLYRAHPEWAMQIDGKPHAEGRYQRVLDLCNPNALEYIIEKMTELFSSCELDYVKWDMNRIFSDIYSPYLKGRQKEVTHRYVLALCQMMDTLVKRFPDILFEGCSAGGNRFDLGILCYFPQIWASDNTDAICRSRMQNSYSYGYPQSVYTCHVSVCPNHQTGRSTSWQNRFNVAAFGNLGYELNPANLNEEDLEEISREVAFYKENRELLMFGKFERENYENDFVWRVSNEQKALKVLIHKDENHFQTVLSED